MGGTVSGDRNNNELVEKMVRTSYLKSPLVHRVFRAVDRADYVLSAERKEAYKDTAWKSGLLHLSSPSIYCDVMEGLELEPGLSFLNLGSGTGYLNTMVGLILGTRGVNHGIELHAEVVQYAKDKLQEFMEKSHALNEFDFCEPKFVVGNCLNLSLPEQQYDRVYCGAGCPKEYENFIKNLIKVEGILVMPMDEDLLYIKRKSHSMWYTKKIHNVSYATLVTPSLTKIQPIVMPEIVPPSLQVLCRTTIRKIMLDVVRKDIPEVLEYLMKSETTYTKNKSKREPYTRVSEICLALNNEDSDTEYNRLHNLDIESGSREVNALLRLVFNMGNTTSENESSDSSDSSDNSDNENSNDENAVSETDDSLNKSSSDKSSNVSKESDSTETANNSSKESSATGELDISKPSSSQSCDESPSKIVTTTENLDSETNKSDSGIVAESSDGWETCSSILPNEDQTDTNSYIDNASNDSSPDITIENSTESSQRKRRITRLGSISSNEKEDSSDIDSNDNSASKPKLKKVSSPPPHPYDVNRSILSNHLQERILRLPLPRTMKTFVNMNRDFTI